MEKKKGRWVTLSLLNLCIVALLGFSLRSKFLFPIAFINYRYFISAHSHFAFGGWVTLALMILYIYYLLPDQFNKKRTYQVILWCTEINALGMAVSFPFKGYALFSILFSTLFIFCTYAFSFVFLRDIFRSTVNRSVKLLATVALAALVVSSVGPFTLAHIMATRSGGPNLYRDAVYTYLHFQYNGFFTLSVFALFFANAWTTLPERAKKRIWIFSVLLALSVVPTLFLSLLWHPDQPWIPVTAMIGCILIASIMFIFFRFWNDLLKSGFFSHPLAKAFWLFSMISFMIKMFLQMGIIIPDLGNAVYGYRPIIIGFLHLIFLGLVSFFILSMYMEKGMFVLTDPFARGAMKLFAAAVFLNEGVLMVQGVGLMLGFNNMIYGWLLWVAAILLFAGAAMIFAARIKGKSVLTQ